MPDTPDPQTDTASTILGISIRAWVTLLLVATVCFLFIFSGVTGKACEVGEPLYSLTIAALGFYFGQKFNKPS